MAFVYTRVLHQTEGEIRKGRPQKAPKESINANTVSRVNKEPVFLAPIKMDYTYLRRREGRVAAAAAAANAAAGMRVIGADALRVMLNVRL